MMTESESILNYIKANAKQSLFGKGKLLADLPWSGYAVALYREVFEETKGIRDAKDDE